MSDVDRAKSLQDLEQCDWGEPEYDSYLVATCHRLRRKPLNQFEVEDLRIMIGQQISLPILMPLALEQLEQDPLACGHFYPGDLLSSVLRADERFWVNDPEASTRIRRVLARLRTMLSTLDEVDRDEALNLLERVAPPSLTRDSDEN